MLLDYVSRVFILGANLTWVFFHMGEDDLTSANLVKGPFVCYSGQIHCNNKNILLEGKLHFNYMNILFPLYFYTAVLLKFSKVLLNNLFSFSALKCFLEHIKWK